MAEAPAVAQRIVPGAPPPAPLSKSQKKKRKGGKKGDETGVDSPVAANGGGSVIGAESEHPEPEEKGLEPPTVPGTNGTHTPALVDEDSGLKLSPIVDLVTKRLKATGKKITRISGYAATDVEKLNDDQKRSIKTLPSLEAVQKELQDVKKAIEVHEAELAHEISAKQNEIEKAAKARTAEAVSAAESTLVDKFNAVLDLIRASHSSGSNAVFLHALLGDDQETRKTVLSGLLSGEGEYEGVSYSQALEEVSSTLHGSAPEPESVTEEIAEQENQAGPGVAISGLPSTLPSGGLQFLHESEIEHPSEESPAPYTEEIEEEIPNGHAHQAPVETASTIDWAADDEHDLPPIAGLHAEFGSGSQTPAADAPGTPAEAKYQGQDEYTPETPGTPNPDVDDDGFVQARPGRGRSRGGRGGEHGGRGGRGGFRGDGRGGYRGGGRGNFRGGERGERGGFRGGDRGAFRGGERGGRGGFRGRPDGEFRGGRGGFRGGRGGDRGGHRASPTPA